MRVELWKRRVLIEALPVSAATGAMSAPQPSARIGAVRCDHVEPLVAPPVEWTGDVVQHAVWSVRLGANGLRNQIAIARVPAARVRFTLEIAHTEGVMRPWTLADAPADAVIAMNAGQFTDERPWGWVVHKQKELLPPGVGPLAGAFVTDSSGAVAILTPAELASWRTPMRATEALQSYPLLLMADGRPPSALCRDQSGIDRTHRDARLAIGLTRAGDFIVALSRFELPGAITSRVPIGPTTPEMAEIMRRLGAVRAMMLDGGLSAQLLVRTTTDTVRYDGLRSVPMALVLRRRD